MIAVKAMYDRGNIKFLEPFPPVERALVAVVFQDVSLEEALMSSYQDAEVGSEGHEPMDAGGAAALMAVLEELAPYRIEAEAACLEREGT